MKDRVKAAERTASALGIIKWAVVVLTVLAGASAVQGMYSATTWSMATIVPLVVLVVAVSALLSWAFIGEKQHSLRMLTILARPPESIEIVSEHVLPAVPDWAKSTSPADTHPDHSPSGIGSGT
jgi:hypothetical protein